MWQTALAGGLLGLVSSLHCVGMCGPLALALPVQQFSKAGQSLAYTAYHTGRVTTYSLLGLLFGWAGRGVYIAGLQQWLSVILGVVTLFLAVHYFIPRKQLQFSWMQRFTQWVQQWMGRFLRQGKKRHYFLLGMTNGLLPCGMVYIAVAAALSSSSMGNAVVFMAMFGAGTLPAMLALTSLRYILSLDIRRQFRKAVPWFITAMGVILILRGLNLGIPFISPVMAEAPPDPVICH
jgi:sulfite exporter TauE/SafE